MTGVLASSSGQDDVLFGKIALNMHFITKERLEQALQYQRTRAPNVPLGEILLQYRLLSREQIDQVLQFQARVKTTLTRPPVPGTNGGPPGPGGGTSDSWAAYQQVMAPPAAAQQPGMSGAPPGYAGSQPYASQQGMPPRGPGYYPQPGAAPVTPAGMPATAGLEATAEVPPDGLINLSIGGCQILAKIGEGGMGAIYRARHETLRKDVVVKILSPESAANPRTVERFRREAQAAAQLEHPNIVQVLNTGTTDRGLHFIVMQFIDGRNLDDVITQKGRHPWKEAVKILTQIASGLQAAHKAGVIHRDIKADNILVTNQGGLVKVADFGLAKDLNSDLKLTADGAMIGTPLYMAPEIGRVKEIDARVDVYSLGVTFYYLLTGVQPFREFSAIEILSAKAHDKLKPPEQFTPDLPEPVRNVLGKTLEKDRDKRYPGMDELLKDLDALDHGDPVSASEPALWGPVGSAVNQSTSGKTKKVVSTASSKRIKATSAILRPATEVAKAQQGYPTWLVVGLVFAFFLVIGLGVVLLILWKF